MQKVLVYTNGSVIGNGDNASKCAWAYKLVYSDERIERNCDSDRGKASCQMEMTAVLEALKSVTDKSLMVECYSDSQYVIETINGNSRIKIYHELWEELMQEIRKFANIHFYWVKNHFENEHNNEVHTMAYEKAKRL